MASLLVIDDDIDSADVLAEVMRSQGHDVRVGHDGREGLRLADAKRPDLALLDVEMPFLDGPGLANAMLLHNLGLESVPVIFLSGVSNLSDVAARVGTPYFLNKPYGFERLLSLVERALTERRSPRPQQRR